VPIHQRLFPSGCIWTRISMQGRRVTCQWLLLLSNLGKKYQLYVLPCTSLRAFCLTRSGVTAHTESFKSLRSQASTDSQARMAEAPWRSVHFDSDHIEDCRCVHETDIFIKLHAWAHGKRREYLGQLASTHSPAVCSVRALRRCNLFFFHH
jgi:hypothetical protein